HAGAVAPRPTRPAAPAPVASRCARHVLLLRLMDDRRDRSARVRARRSPLELLWLGTKERVGPLADLRQADRGGSKLAPALFGLRRAVRALFSGRWPVATRRPDDGCGCQRTLLAPAPATLSALREATPRRLVGRPCVSPSVRRRWPR